MSNLIKLLLVLNHLAILYFDNLIEVDIIPTFLSMQQVLIFHHSKNEKKMDFTTFFHFLNLRSWCNSSNNFFYFSSETTNWATSPYFSSHIFYST